MFRKGDKIYSVEFGWGYVTDVRVGSFNYPLEVLFEKRTIYYTLDGRRSTLSDCMGTLFFQEIPIPKEALERPRWRARINHTYYYINSDGNIASDIDNGLYLDDARFKVGNYFKTSEEARQSKFYKVFREEE